MRCRSGKARWRTKKKNSKKDDITLSRARGRLTAAEASGGAHVMFEIARAQGKQCAADICPRPQAGSRHVPLARAAHSFAVTLCALRARKAEPSAARGIRAERLERGALDFFYSGGGRGGPAGR